jgi:hypothetical protein
MTWLTLLRLLLGLADKVADIIRAKQLMDAGEAKATAKQLAGMAERLGISEALDAERDKLTIDQVKDALREDAR